MERTSLARRRTQTKGGRGAGAYEWRGIRLRAVDDALNALDIHKALSEEGGDKMPALLGLLFPGELMGELASSLPPDMPAEDLGPLVASVLWDAFGIDVTGEHSQCWEAPVFDFDEDAARIRATLLMAYGLDWDEARTRLSYSELCDLLAAALESGQETPFREAVYYRTAKPPKAQKGNEEYREAWLRRRDHFALDAAKPTPEQMARSHNDAMAGMFAAAERAARIDG